MRHPYRTRSERLYALPFDASREPRVHVHVIGPSVSAPEARDRAPEFDEPWWLIPTV